MLEKSNAKQLNSEELEGVFCFDAFLLLFHDTGFQQRFFMEHMLGLERSRLNGTDVSLMLPSILLGIFSRLGFYMLLICEFFLNLLEYYFLILLTLMFFERNGNCFLNLAINVIIDLI